MGAIEQEFEKLERDARKLLEELEFALKRALLAFKDPKGTANTYRNRFKAWKAQADRFVAKAPHAKAFVDQLSAATAQRLEQLIATATRAHGNRAKVDQGLAGKYNDVVANALADAPKQGTSALDDQINGAVKKLVHGTIQEEKIPPHVKDQIARSLSGWLRQQDAVDDAFVFLQRSMYDVAKWLHQRLVITKEIDHTRAQLAKRGELTPAEADAADEHVGELAKQRRELDRMIEAQIAKHQTQTTSYFAFSPKLVLDPAKHFVDKLELQAGIKIKQSDVVVDLGTKLRIVDPTLDSRQLTVNPYAKVKIGNDFSAGVEYQGSFQGNQQQHGVKATLSWRF